MSEAVASHRGLPAAQQPDWGTPELVAQVRDELAGLPALVTEHDVIALRAALAQVAAGHAQILQAGDCAEDPAESTPGHLARKTGLIDTLAGLMKTNTRKPVLRVGRIAGQYAKPRSSATEIVHGVELPVYRGHIANAARLRRTAAALGIPVAYTAQPGGMTKSQRGLLKDFWGPGMTPTPSDREVVEQLAPAAGDWRLTKWRYSAFFNTELRARMWRSGRDQLVICGVYAHVGVLMSAVEAFTYDIQPFLVADATADFSEAEHRLALDYAAGRCAVVTTTDDVLAQLSLTEAA
jgi:isochorismate hydrolase